jgi:hypothetical protein
MRQVPAFDTPFERLYYSGLNDLPTGAGRLDSTHASERNTHSNHACFSSPGTPQARRSSNPAPSCRRRAHSGGVYELRA